MIQDALLGSARVRMNLESGQVPRCALRIQNQDGPTSSDDSLSINSQH